MTKTLDRLRRDAKALRQAHEAGTPDARARIATYQPRPEGRALKHADYLHVIARENSFASWPALKEAVEIMGMDGAAKLQRLKIALHHGQVEVVERQQHPELPSQQPLHPLALPPLLQQVVPLAVGPGLAPEALEEPQLREQPRWSLEQEGCSTGTSRQAHRQPHSLPDNTDLNNMPAF